MNSEFKRQVFSEALKVSHLTYQIGEIDLLRKKSKPVKLLKITTAVVRLIISKLKNTLLEYRKLTGKGRGIAAIQIGIPLKIAVIFDSKKLIVIINPKITEKSKTLYLYPEICMSANPIIAKVVRPSWVKIKYLDESGEKKIWENKKNLILNRVLQHEIDHMEGIINIDLVQSNQLILNSDPDFFKMAKFEKV